MNRTQLLAIIDRLISHNKLTKYKLEAAVKMKHGGKTIRQLTQPELENLYQYLLVNTKKKAGKKRSKIFKSAA